MSESAEASSGPRPRKRRQRKPTRERLERIALHYLGRYAASTETLRRVLRRRVARAAAEMPVDQDAVEGWIEEIVAKLRRLGMLDDAGYAAARARSLHRQGRSRRHIRGSLNEKGIDGALIDAALSENAEAFADPEFAAACHFARRRRLGPFSHKDPSDERRRRELAALGRAGFGYRIAIRIVDASSADSLEDEALVPPP